MDIYDEIEELKNKYHELTYFHKNEKLIVRGIFIFNAEYKDICIKDQYTIEIIIPNNYPESLPAVKEISGSIDKSYHTNLDGTLCLGVNMDILIKIKEKNISLINFVELFVVPYLYRYSYIQKYQQEPWSDRNHGIDGIFQFYRNYFKIDNDIIIFNMIKILRFEKYRGHQMCICGSNKIFRKCHGEKLLYLKKISSRQLFSDAQEMYASLKTRKLIRSD